jgi:hypothetical protein
MSLRLFRSVSRFKSDNVLAAGAVDRKSLSAPVVTVAGSRRASVRPVWQGALCAFAIYSLITIFITYPIAFRLTSVLPGGFRDAYQHLWSLWWTKKALLELGDSPANLTYLYSPMGMYHPLLWVTPYVQLLSIPLQTPLGLIGTYNLLWLISFSLCGLTMYLLGYYLTGSQVAAFVTGLIFAFFPNKFAHSAGHYLQLPIYWFPLYVLYLFKLFRSPSRKNTILCGIFLAFSSLIHIIHTAYFVIPITLAFLAGQFFSRSDRRAWLRFVRHFTLAGIIALALVSPFYGPYLYSSLTSSTDYISEAGDVSFSSDLLSFLVPFENHPFWRNIEPVHSLAHRLVPEGGNALESLAYVGWLPLGLALVGIYAKRRQSTMWWIIAIVAAVLSLGPLLHVNGHLVNEKFDGLSSHVVLPYAVLDRIPFYNEGRTPGRFNETVLFSLAILAGFGIEWLISTIRPVVLRRASLIIITLLIIFEYLTWWPTPVTAAPPTPKFFAGMPGTAQDAVLTFPTFLRQKDHLSLAGSRDMYFQTIHEHKITGGFIWRWSPMQKGRSIALDELLMPERDVEIVDFPSTNEVTAILNGYHVRYVVVYKPWKEHVDWQMQSLDLGSGIEDYSYLDAMTASNTLRHLFGPPIIEDAFLWAFEVPAHLPVNLDNATMMYVGSGWNDVVWDRGIPERWMNNDAHLYVERLTSGYARLSFQVKGSAEGWLDLIVNGQPVQRFPVTTSLKRYTTEPIILDTGRNLLVFRSPNLCSNGDGDCSSFRFSAISLQPATFTVDRMVSVGVGDSLSLVRFGQSRRSAYPGEPLSVVLTWRAQSNITQDYKVFVHLIDAQGNQVLQHDVEPDNWGYPTTSWTPGMLVRDLHRLLIPDDLPNGLYTIQVGMYREDTLERLEVFNSSEPVQYGAITLGTLEVVAPGQ